MDTNLCVCVCVCVCGYTNLGSFHIAPQLVCLSLCLRFSDNVLSECQPNIGTDLINSQQATEEAHAERKEKTQNKDDWTDEHTVRHLTLSRTK